MEIKLTTTQEERLVELSAEEEVSGAVFESEEERNAFFKETERKYVKQNKERLRSLLTERHLPASLRIQRDLENWLIGQEGFTQVQTPTIISKEMLDKMTITQDNELSQQVFWLDRKKCLRPMLAPNLYIVMRDLYKTLRLPVKIFEVGSCFRKESQGAKHMNEFTMLNMVEYQATEDGKQMERLEEMARGAMKALGIEDYELVKEKSGVYHETLDIDVDGVEVASGSFGPHSLDGAWGVTGTWVGFGFGIERLALVKSRSRTIKRFGRSIVFVDGSPVRL